MSNAKNDLNAISPPMEKRFISSFAPLNPEGPLPPAVTEDSVVSAYKSCGLNPKRALLTLKIKQYKELSTTRLRLALDRPDARRGRIDKALPPFCQAIYTWQRKYSENIYNRVIRPAEYERERRIFIAPGRLRSLLDAERSEARICLSDRVATGSEEESLAYFVLAYALLQPGEAYDIMEPLLLLNPCFQDFFGVTKAQEMPRCPDIRNETLITNQSMPRTEEKKVIEPQSINDYKSAIKIEGEAIEDKDLPSSIGVKALEIKVEPTFPISETDGPRMALLRRFETQYEIARGQRCELGATLDFDRDAFEKSLEKEKHTSEERKKAFAKIREEYSDIFQNLNQGLMERNIEFKIEKPDIQVPSKVAAWLDCEQDNISEILGLVRDISQKETFMMQVRHKGDHKESGNVVAYHLFDVIGLLHARLNALNKEIAEIREWETTLESLRLELADCDSPKNSKSMMNIDPELIFSIFQHSMADEYLEPLVPLFFRLLWDNRSRYSTDYQNVALAWIDTFLKRGATSKDAETYNECLSYLTLPILQDLLTNGNEVLARHIILITFSQSLAQRHALFFNDVWPFEPHRWNRAHYIGDRLYELFNSLYRLYLQTQNINLVIQALMSDSGVRGEGESERRIAITRRQSAEALAISLESPGNVSGNFYKLRQIACLKFFKPIVPLIRNLRIREVQKELSAVHRMFQDGQLEMEILNELEDSRYLRTAHRRSLQRYIEGRMEAIRVWIKQESSWSIQENIKAEDRLSEDIRLAINRLSIGGDKERRKSESIEDIEWLEDSIGKLILDLRKKQFPAATILFFGELPQSDSLFMLGSEGMVGRERANQWPAWLDESPKSENSWVRHLHGNLTWKNLLQDGIAKIILGRSRAPKDILRSFITCGEFEAAIEAIKFPEFEDAPLKIIAGEAKEKLAKAKEVEGIIYQLDQEILGLERLNLSKGQGTVIQRLKMLLYEGLDALENNLVDKCKELVETISKEVVTIQEESKKEGAERKRRIESLKAWLSDAKVAIPDAISIEEAERLVKEVQSKAKARRTHLMRLQELDYPAVPEPLREAIRNYVANEDKPSSWPEADSAGYAELFIENLIEVSRDWWNMLKALNEGDVTFQMIQEMTNLLARELPIEIRHILNNEPNQAIILSLLFDKATWTAGEFHKVLQQNNMLPGAEEFRREKKEETDQEEEIGLAGRQAQARIEALIKEGGYLPGSGEMIEEAYAAFREGKYGEVCKFAGPGWVWTQSGMAKEEISPLVAIFAWAKFKSSGPLYERYDLDVIGLLFKNAARICERARGLLIDEMFKWWIELIHGEKEDGSDKTIGERVAATLIKLGATNVGDEQRERFNAIIRIAGADSIVTTLWEMVRNLKDDTTKARSALLVMLYDFGEKEGLDHLFKYAGNYRKYLAAFVSLSRHAITDPTRKFHSAISQNLRTLQGLKDRPFKEFTDKIAQRLQYKSPGVKLEAVETLERDKKSKDYILSLSILPDEGDPPLTLKVELLGEGDFVCGDNEMNEKEVVKESLLFERREIEYMVRPKKYREAAIVALRTSGETASGQRIDEIHRLRVQLGGDDRYEPIPVDELLEIYSGFDARPVSGPAFVGREEELAILERSLVRPNPGAVILYGVRRLGKTSILDELRRRHCVSYRKGSQTLFIVIPMDEFSVGSTSKPFLERFLRHIWSSVLHDPKNRRFHDFMETEGVTRQQLQLAAHLDETFDGASFIARLREYFQKIRGLAGGKIRQVVLVLDEFDKLLEHYRKGFQADVEDLTNQLRRAATEEPDIGLILAGSDLMKGIIGQYRNALYGSATVVQLECFEKEKDRAAAMRIISPPTLKGKRVFSDPVVDDIIRFTGGHPLYIRLVACSAASTSRRQRISRGVAIDAINKLLRNDVLQGYLPDAANLVKQQLQVLRLLDLKDQPLAEMLLLQLAHYTTLERPYANWGVFASDDRLLNIRPADTWARLRDELKLSNLIMINESRQWSFRFPILAERLRIDGDVEFERLQTEIISKMGSDK